MKVILRQRSYKLTDKELIADLKKAARKLHTKSISREQYTQVGKYYASTMSYRFGSWTKALRRAGLQLVRHAQWYADEQLFRNIAEVWIKLGRQPTATDMKSAVSLYAFNTYRKRFGGWRQSLEHFADYVNNNRAARSVSGITAVERQPFQRRRMRSGIGKHMRHKILARDKFRCVHCGASPKNNLTVRLHVDHIRPVSKGGETIPDNLQTLCEECNLGKCDE